MTWKLKRTRQCAKCPWRADVDPNTIPDGYDVEKHKALADTIAKPGDLSGLLGGPLRIMACHETHDAHCIGWLVNQEGPGNNIALRMQLRHCENADRVRIVGRQHETFEQTLPKKARAAAARALARDQREPPIRRRTKGAGSEYDK
jgi:hypothetical protein